jgi:predicted DNA-binding transcriptional regulator AlpA
MSHWTDFLDPSGPDGAYLPWKKVEPRIGISRTTAWRLQKTGDFPKPYVVSPGRVAYRESEVEAWKASRGHRSADQAPPPARAASALAVETPLPPTPTSEPPSWSPPQPAQSATPLVPTPAARKPEPISRTPRQEGRSRDRPSGGDQMKFEF